MSLESVRQDIEELNRSLGVKELIAFQPLADLHARGDHVRLCGAIGAYTGLPNAVRLQTVSDRLRFKAQAPSRIEMSGQGTRRTVAQVTIPANLPTYGTAAFPALVIEVLVAEDFALLPPHTAIAVLAHEMSHVLLHSLKHPNRDSEPFTDLVPIVLGFGLIVDHGSVVSTSERRGDTIYTSTVTYGYLTDEEFALARDLVQIRLADRSVKKRAVLSLVTRVLLRASEAGESSRAISAALRQLDSTKRQCVAAMELGSWSSICPAILRTGTVS